MLLKVKILLVIGVAGLCQGDCDGKCDIPITHYKELGCKAVYEGAEKCCPKYFDCNSFEGRSGDKCHFKGQVYNVGDRVDTELTAGNCLAGCFCSQGGKFICAHIDCAEFFGANPVNPGCYRAYKHESCCSIGNECPPFKGLAKCEVNGKTYHEGQRFDAPGVKNLNCICKKNFAGKYEEPFCTPVVCGVELLHSNDFKNNCAPVYYGKDGLCPIQWQCTENIQSIQLTKDNKGVTRKCKFNDKELSVGDKVILSKPYEQSPEINCECLIPPIVTCIQKPHDA